MRVSRSRCQLASSRVHPLPHTYTLLLYRYVLPTEHGNHHSKLLVQSASKTHQIHDSAEIVLRRDRQKLYEHEFLLWDCTVYLHVKTWWIFRNIDKLQLLEKQARIKTILAVAALDALLALLSSLSFSKTPWTCARSSRCICFLDHGLSVRVEVAKAPTRNESRPLSAKICGRNK